MFRVQAGNPWLDTLIVVTALEAATAVVGYAIGHLFLSLWLVTLAFLAWQLQYVLRLDRWLHQGGIAAPPDAPGIWGDVFNSLRRAQERHRRRRRTLADLLARSKQAADAVPDAVVVLGPRGELEWWNVAATRLLGLQAPRDAGQLAGALLRHPDFRTLLAADRYREALTIPSPVLPSVILEVRLVPFGERRRLLLARDVTRLVRLERMRRDFVANVSHELRTPLTVIHGVAETLVDSDEDGAAEQREALELLLQQTQRMRRLVEDLLLLSRLETTDASANQQVVAVAPLLQQLCQEAQTLSDGRHRIELNADATLALRGEESELRSAFSNLIINAVKYTPAGGEIRIDWRRIADGACLEVCDTGPGIAAEHLPRLTERFYRVDRGRSSRTGGTGLGLAIVKHVLHRHEGRLQIESELGVGSSFRCLFPASRLAVLT
ncbi:MAG: phosphate regulon sensor histidine kinase PhoR [Xanthomonadaceae bacterium]|nr:phosphate regulon sensor histidine kinase PhoR [Xanthomonadaceae bacterium]